MTHVERVKTTKFKVGARIGGTLSKAYTRREAGNVGVPNEAAASLDA
jgi:hypothetical protein